MARNKGIGDMIDDLLGGDDTQAGQKGGQSSGQGRGWHGDPKGHARAGSQSSGNQNAAVNLSDHDRSKGGQASAARQDMSELGRKGGKTAQERGTAHDLTDEERSRGGRA